jgi:hypothetical protein
LAEDRPSIERGPALVVAFSAQCPGTTRRPPPGRAEEGCTLTDAEEEKSQTYCHVNRVTEALKIYLTTVGR